MKDELKKTILAIADIIKKDKRVVIFGHVNPDGDAIGSTLGLYHYLLGKVADVQVIVPNDFPDFLKWMPGVDSIMCFDQNPLEAKKSIAKADLLFFCDFNDPKRASGIGDHIGASNGTRIMIDHHPQPVDFVDFMISDTSVSSTSELVFELIEGIESEAVRGIEMAECLMTGIITDTGLFHHNSETRRTFEIVGKLLELGADKSKIINKLYNEYPYTRMQLLGNTLHNRLRFYPNLSTAFVFLTKEDMDKYNYQNGDSEGFVNMALSIDGANFAAIFVEKDDHVKTSFRSIGKFDVNEFARKHYNGGGHKNASGGKSFDPLTKTIDGFVELLKDYKKDIMQSV